LSPSKIGVATIPTTIPDKSFGNQKKKNFKLNIGDQKVRYLKTIEMKRITRCKLAVLLESAYRRKFLGQFGSKVASL